MWLQSVAVDTAASNYLLSNVAISSLPLQDMLQKKKINLAELLWDTGPTLLKMGENHNANYSSSFGCAA